jgi:hypothetical protein
MCICLHVQLTEASLQLESKYFYDTFAASSYTHLQPLQTYTQPQNQVGFPIIADWATSAMAMGNVQACKREGKELPPGVAVGVHYVFVIRMYVHMACVYWYILCFNESIFVCMIDYCVCLGICVCICERIFVHCMHVCVSTLYHVIYQTTN